MIEGTIWQCLLVLRPAHASGYSPCWCFAARAYIFTYRRAYIYSYRRAYIYTQQCCTTSVQLHCWAGSSSSQCCLRRVVRFTAGITAAV